MHRSALCFALRPKRAHFCRPWRDQQTHARPRGRRRAHVAGRRHVQALFARAGGRRACKAAAHTHATCARRTSRAAAAKKESGVISDIDKRAQSGDVSFEDFLK